MDRLSFIYWWFVIRSMAEKIQLVENMTRYSQERLQIKQQSVWL
jgi:hypothetical protein